MRRWVIGVALVAVIALAGLWYMGYIPTGDDTSSDVKIIFYDADGNELGRIDTGLAIFGIQAAGFEGDIAYLDITSSYLVETDIDYTSLYVDSFLEVVTTLNTAAKEHVYTVAEHHMMRDNNLVRINPLDAPHAVLDGSVCVTYMMSGLLPASEIDEAGKENGWLMTFNVRTNAVLTLPDGTTAEIEDDCNVTLTLSWIDPYLTLSSWVSY